MCWNARVSLNTFAFSAFVALLAYINRRHIDVDMRLVLFMLTFSLMQLAEAGVWTYLNDPAMNRFFTNVVVAVLMLELVAAGNLIDTPKIKYGYYALVLIWLTIFFAGGIYKPLDVHSARAKNGHLQWIVNNRPQPILFIYVPLLLLPFLIIIRRDPFPFVLGFGLFVISYITFKTGNTVASTWCWVANVLWIGILYKIMIGTCKKM